MFRVGDFYETFGEDAITVSEICGVTLTRRANGSANSVELAGFPYKALDTYLPKLTRADKRCAICELTDDNNAKIVEDVKPNPSEEPKPKKNMKTNEVKEINCIYGIDEMREKGEPIAWFTIDIPKEAKNMSKCINKKKNFCRPSLLSICIEPTSNKIVASDTHVLQMLEAKCEGVWPDGGEVEMNGIKIYRPFQCNIDPKAINALAGKKVDVAVWEKDGKLDVTACEAQGVRSQYAETNNHFPNWQRVIPKEFKRTIQIASGDIAPMVAWLRQNVGKTTPDSRGEWSYNNRVVLTIDERVMTLTILTYDNDEYRWKETVSYKAAHDSEVKEQMKVCFVAYLALLSMDGDFNGKIGFNKTTPSVFFGKYRDSLNMPLVLNEE